MNIIFFGTSDFAVPSLTALAQSELFDIEAVVTQPDRPVGRKQVLTPPPIKVKAEELGLKVLQPSELNNVTIKQFNNVNIDLFIVVSYGKIIPQEILDIPLRGTINVHPSLLPKYRGPSPMQYALLNGDNETGVTVMLLDNKMDHGPILANIEYRISKSETYPELSEKLSKIGADLLIKAIPDYISKKIEPKAQDHEKATYTKLIKKEYGHIDWNKSAEEIYNIWRAYHPWPGIFTFTEDNKRIKIIECKPVGAGLAVPRSTVAPDRNVGTIHESPEGNMIATCADNTYLEILTLQPEGKQLIQAEDYLKGNKQIKFK